MKKFFIPFIILLLIGFTFSTLQAQTKKTAHPALAMSDMAIDDLLAAMKNQRGDDAKMIVIKNGIQHNTDGIMVDQELRLLNQFATDEGKIDCAEFLYRWCVDYKNYAKIQYNLGTPVAQKTLTDFIKNKESSAFN